MKSYSNNNYTPGFYFTEYGSMYILFYRGKVIITIGPHWPILLVFNLLILAIHLVLFFALLKDFPLLRYTSTISFTFLQFSFLSCGLKDPGVMFPSMDIEMNSNKFCHKCGADRSGHHCNVCDVCIEGHDHHCGFVGKCVGKGNLRAFYCLLIGVFTSSLIFVLTLAWRTWSLKRETS